MHYSLESKPFRGAGNAIHSLSSSSCPLRAGYVIDAGHSKPDRAWPLPQETPPSGGETDLSTEAGHLPVTLHCLGRGSAQGLAGVCSVTADQPHSSSTSVPLPFPKPHTLCPWALAPAISPPPQLWPIFYDLGTRVSFAPAIYLSPRSLLRTSSHPNQEPPWSPTIL